MVREVVILTCDTPDSDGVVWPLSVVQEAISAANIKISKTKFFGSNRPECPYFLDSSKSSHRITGLSIDKDKNLVCEITTLLNPKGTTLEDKINASKKLKAKMQTTGQMNSKKNEVSAFEILSIDVVEDSSGTVLKTIN